MDMIDRLNGWLGRSILLGCRESPGSALKHLGRTKVRARDPDADVLSNLTTGVLRLNKASVFACHAETDLVIELDESSERYIFWMPTSGKLAFAQGGNSKVHNVNCGQIGIVPANAQLKTRLGRGTRLLALVAPQPALLSALETLAGLTVTGHVSFDDTVLSLKSVPGSLISQLLHVLEPIVTDDGLRRNLPALTSQLETLMMLSLLSSLPHNFTHRSIEEPGAPQVAPAVVSHAESYMKRHADESIRLDDIVMATGYSARTVQLAFRRFRKTTPMAYLRRLRLERIYHELSHPRMETTVADVARAWHFPSSGRMSARFQEIFGESPQQVLRRGRRGIKP